MTKPSVEGFCDSEFSELEAIFDINIQKLSGNDTLIGQNMIALVRGETVTKRVTIN